MLSHDLSLIEIKMNFGTSTEHHPVDVTWTGHEAPKGLPVILPAQVIFCTLAHYLADGLWDGAWAKVTGWTRETLSQLPLLGR